VFSAAVRANYDKAFEYLLELETKTTNVDLKQELIGALAATRLPERGAQLLGRIKDPTLVRQHDVDLWLVYMLRNRYLRSQTWQWFRDNWDWIEKTFARDKSFDYFPRLIASTFNTRKLMEEFKVFFEPLKHWTSLVRNITMGIEELENRISWLERDVAALRAALKSTDQSPPL
jgi:aminopeptidase N